MKQVAYSVDIRTICTFVTMLTAVDD